jgi:hypothetical protein
MKGFTVPLPVPTAVAVNIVPAVLEVAPIRVKSVLPLAMIVYVLPTCIAVTAVVASAVTEDSRTYNW